VTQTSERTTDSLLLT